ncbi:DUF624 domain-containing protein [Bacillus sp. FJAT-27251]|uniref:YesL family protein n=1 Tax=Bacillus sp. FJAT-27251 TaxID=1684142 RepID=UPI0006A7BCDF|nr:DUF624 domain-containing protein [Bacillus sp. FJAT-27251]
MTDHMLSKINFIGEWTFRLAYVNLLWICFSVLGLFLFGFFPATAAMFTVIRKWRLKEQVPIFQTFKETYRKEFTDANKVGWLLMFIGFFLYIDFFILFRLEGSIFLFLAFILIPLTFVYLSILLYIFPVFVHFQLKNIEYIKYAFIISLSYPHLTILMLLGSFVLISIYLTFPMFFPLLLGSSLSTLCMYISKRVVQKLEKGELAVPA